MDLSRVKLMKIAATRAGEIDLEADFDKYCSHSPKIAGEAWILD
jgi:hypothetical protein